MKYNPFDIPNTSPSEIAMQMEEEDRQREQPVYIQVQKDVLERTIAFLMGDEMFDPMLLALELQIEIEASEMERMNANPF